MSPEPVTLHAPAVSLREAAAALGVSEAAVRRMVKAGTLRATREPRPQGFAWRVVLPAGCAAPPDTTSPNGTLHTPRPPGDGTLRPPRAAPDAAPAATSIEVMRAEALAAYGATLLAPVLAELEVIRQENRAQAETIGTLRAQLAAAEASAGGQLAIDPSSVPPLPLGGSGGAGGDHDR